MIQFLNPIIGATTIAVLILVIVYALGSRNQFQATLADRQQHEDGSVMLTFLISKKTKLELKVGQQILIRTKQNEKGRQFTPLQNAAGSFKILVIPSMSVHEQEDKIIKQLQELKKQEIVYINIAGSNFKYVGNSQIRIKNQNNNEEVTKKFTNIYILAQGNKLPIAYQIVKSICQEKSETKPMITIFFVGSGFSDFVLKNEFEHLEENYDNINTYYSVPVKGERQPSIAGLGISSQKVSQSFNSEVSSTFCILCAELGDLCVTVERALLNKKVPAQQIYKY